MISRDRYSRVGLNGDYNCVAMGARLAHAAWGCVRCTVLRRDGKGAAVTPSARPGEFGNKQYRSSFINDCNTKSGQLMQLEQTSTRNFQLVKAAACSLFI